ncbi:hypothetical protein MGN70_003511 [Eutypa lata]|nr:hypothetical protein MGN70_003511 [Eutypa lata]
MTKEEAITELSVERSTAAVRNYNDLAMGTGGDFRYIRGSHDGEDGITKVGLFRLDKELSPEEIKERIGQSGFSHYSEDINKGRGGEYLYLIWAY